MKRLFLIMAVAAIATLSACSEKPVTLDKLPDQARVFISTYFPGQQVTFAKQDPEFFCKTYEVVLDNSSTVKFNGRGQWKEIATTKMHHVPATVVPTAIQEYVLVNYPLERIIGIDKEGRRYEVKLSNDLDLTFNSDFVLVDIDD